MIGDWKISLLFFLFVKMFQILDALIKAHGDDAQDDDGCDHHI